MVDSDNKLGKAKKLSVPGNRVDSLGSTDLEDLHRFTLDKRSQVTLSLSKIGKGAKVRTELYALTGSLNKRLKKTDFSKLGAKDLQGILRRVSASELGDLAVGEYYVRVFGGKGKSRYKLKLSAAPIVDAPVVSPPVVVGVTPPIETPITPPVTLPITPPIETPITPPAIPPITPPIETPPITPPIETPVKSAKAKISRNPNGPRYTAELDFSKSQDEDPAEDRGLFKGAVVGTIDNSRGLTYFLTDNLVSFINADGQTEYQAKLLNVSGSGKISPRGESYDALFIKFILPVSYEADPDSLSSLQKAFDGIAQNVDDGERLKEDVYFGYGTGLEKTTFDSTNLALYSVEHNGTDGNDYIEFGNHYGRYLSNSDTAGGIGNDTIYAGNDDDYYIDGEEDNDLLYGRAGNDELYGGNGNDSLYGGDGDDTLNGFLSFDDTGTISGEQFDYLTGGNGIDYFVLGESNKVFYHGAGDEHAVIEDWDPVLDYIQTQGDASQYRLEFRDVIGSMSLDTEIYYASGTIDDLIAIVKDTTNVSFSRDFRFV